MSTRARVAASPLASFASRVAPSRVDRIGIAKNPSSPARFVPVVRFFPAGIAHAGVGIHATKGDKNKRAMTVTVGDAATVVKGIFQQQAKTVAALTAAARPDLVCDALAKASAVQKSRRAQPDAAKASALNNVTRKGKKRFPRQLNEQKQSAVCPDNQRGVSVLE